MPTVRAVKCSHDASDDQVLASLIRATDPLADAWAKLETAKLITIKFNQAWPNARIRTFRGQNQEHVDERVARALLTLLKQRTKARIAICDISVEGGGGGLGDYALMPVFREFDVDVIDGDQPPYTLVDVPHDQGLFKRYMLPECVAHADAVISVQKIKNHKAMGVTLCMKNLFGLLTRDPWFHGRHYFHHFVRLPHMLADLGAIIQPCLNVLDGLSSQRGGEWNGKPFVTNTLMAGDNVVSTDAMATHLMGHNPLGDYPSPPYIRDKNHLGIAHRAGTGTADRSEIDFESEVDEPIGQFYCERMSSPEQTRSWLRTTCEQALYYRDNMARFSAYAGRYILLQDQVVRWVGDSARLQISRSVLSGGNPDSAMWLKYVDPDETEGENYAIYKDLLQELDWIERYRRHS